MPSGENRVIPAKEFHHRIRNATRAMQEQGLSGLILTMTSDIRYLTNYNPLVAGDSHVEGAALILTEKSEPSLLIDFPSDMPRARSLSVVSGVRFSPTLGTGISEELSKAKVNGRVGIAGWGVFPTPAYLTLQRDHPQTKLEVADELLRDERMKKSPSEIKLLKKALKISEEALEKAWEALKEGVTEFELAVIIDSTMRSLGSEGGFAFPTIIISGLRSNLMIGFPSRRKIRRGEPVLMDLGARVEGYCADLSRTLVCGRPNQKQKEVVAAIHQMYAELVRRSKPGMGANDLDKASAKVAKECGFGSNVQHLAGHGVGIDVHEKPLFDVENTPLMPSTVDALEPGLYVPSVGGFIVENTAIITDSGCEVWNKIPLGQ